MNKIILILLFLVGVVLLGFIFANWHIAYAPGYKMRSAMPTISPTATLANPASVNCTQKGGTLRIHKLPNGDEYGLCDFGDNMACEEWALMRGNCPIGGIKTTGYDNIEQKYCAWLGGKTYAVPNATCQLPNGHTCLDADLYNGACN